MRKGRVLSLAFGLYLSLGTASAAPRAKPVPTSAPLAATKTQAAKTMEVAQKVYLQGAAHYKAGRLLEALAAFRASYDMVASPNSHIMIARCLRDKGDIAQAYAEYERVVVEADQAMERDSKYRATADAARSERSKLREKLTMVIVRVRNPPDDLHVVVGDKSIERIDWGKPVPVLAGPLVALGVAGGRPDQRKEVAGFPGDELVVSFDYSTAPPAPVEPTPPKKADDELKPTRFPPSDAVPDIPRQPSPQRSPPPDRTWGYVALGAGGAGLVTFFAFGALNQSVYNDLQASCPNMHCPRNEQDEVDKGRRYQVIANVGLGLAVVGASVGAILLTSGDDAGSPSVDVARRRPQRFLVTDVAIGPGSLQVRGAF